MKILLISNYYPPYELGGLEQNAREIAQKFEDRGHQVRIFTSNYPVNELKIPDNNVYRVLNLESPDHVNYHPIYSLKKPVLERRNIRILSKIVEEFSPEIIFIWGMWNLPVSIAKFAEAQRPGLVAYYIASYWPLEQDAHTNYWNDLSVKWWLKTSKRFIGRFISSTLLSGPLRNQLEFPIVMCVSEYLRNVLIDQAGIPREQTRVVHNGIDVDVFSQKDYKTDTNNLHLLYTGRLSPDKGVHTAIESIGILRKKYPLLNICFTIVGNGTSDYEHVLHQLVNYYDVKEKVKFTGWVPRSKIPDILKEHDVFILPSLWPEPLARAVQEAMACGLVVIGTSTGGTPEILVDNSNGLTFEAGDSTELAERIVQLANDPFKYEKLGRAARMTIEEKFTLPRMVDEIEDILHVQLSKNT